LLTFNRLRCNCPGAIHCFSQQARDENRPSPRSLGLAAKVGSLTPGKFADLFAVPNDPLTDITGLERVKFVMKSGVVWKDLRSAK